MATAVQSIDRTRAIHHPIQVGVVNRQMTQYQKASRLIGDIYDASLDPAMWTVVLEQIAEFVGGPAAALALKDSGNVSAQANYQFGLDPEYMQQYSSTYSKFDPLATIAVFGVGQVVTSRTSFSTMSTARVASSKNGPFRKGG